MGILSPQIEADPTVEADAMGRPPDACSDTLRFV